MAAKKKARKTIKPPKVAPQIEDISADKQIGLSPGRPLGSKNQTTIFKEAMQNGFQKQLQKDGYKVFKAVVAKALGEPLKDAKGEFVLDEDGDKIYPNGDSTAQKMIMDRLVPTGSLHQSDVQRGTGGITINISKLVASTGTSEEYEGEYTEGEIEDAVIVEPDK